MSQDDKCLDADRKRRHATQQMLNNDLTAGNTIINHIIKELINYVKSP